MKILLAIDGSIDSQAAIEEVSRRLYPLNTKIRIVSAYEKIPVIKTDGSMGVSQEFFAESDRFALKAAEDTIENAAKFLHKKNPTLTITTVVIEGDPKSVILEEAEKFDADLIVVGSHGCGVVERFLLGSVSHEVSLHAKCSVLKNVQWSAAKCNY